MSKGMQVEGFVFLNAGDYKRAQKEAQIIVRLRESTDIYQADSALQIYNKAVAKETFHTPVGLSFMKELQDIIARQHLVQRDMLNPIPVPGDEELLPGSKELNPDRLMQKLNDSEMRVKRQRVVIVGLIAVVVGIIVIVSKLQYSAFTYFTNYEDKIRNQIINEYEEWEERLTEKEAEQADTPE